MYQMSYFFSLFLDSSPFLWLWTPLRTSRDALGCKALSSPRCGKVPVVLVLSMPILKEDPEK